MEGSEEVPGMGAKLGPREEERVASGAGQRSREREAGDKVRGGGKQGADVAKRAEKGAVLSSMRSRRPSGPRRQYWAWREGDRSGRDWARMPPELLHTGLRQPGPHGAGRDRTMQPDLGSSLD